jgi:hypothetical protein
VAQRARRRTEPTLATCLALTILAACGASTESPPNSLVSSGAGGELVASGGASAGVGARGGVGGSVTVTVPVPEGGAGGDCERELTLQAVTLGEPPPFDLIIVADHSMSLAWSRDELSRGLRDLLTHVQGRAVRIFLLTPTQYGASSADARVPLTGNAVVPWQDPATGGAYEDAMTSYSQACTDPAGAVIACPDPKGKTPYKVEGKWAFVMPEPIATLEPNMTPQAFAAEADAVKAAILAIGGTGSPHEQPLCTLARYVSQPAEKLPKNAVFLIISDEDDVSTPDDCMVSHKGELKLSRVEQGALACSTGCDAYRYTMNGVRHWKRFPFTCAAFNDTGVRISGTEKSSWYNRDFQANCDGIVPGPCSDAEKAEVARFCDSGLMLADCSRECASQDIACSVDLGDPSNNACSGSFQFNGQAWQNLAAYCATQGSGWGTCSGGGVKFQYADSYSGSYSHTNLMSGMTTDAVAAYIKTKVGAAFAAGSTLLEGIVFDPSFPCALGSGQSYATNIARFVADKSRLFPLCESYAPALEGVLGFAQALIQTEFVLSLKPDEHVTSVVVIAKDGTRRSLAPSEYRFDEATGKLTIARPSLRSTDANLRVEITSDCRPIIR